MVQKVEAVYEHGVLRPLGPLDLKEAEQVTVSISNSSRHRSIDDMIAHDFVAYARAHVAKLDRIPTLEEVRRGLSSIEGSMSEFIIAERGEY